MRGFETVYCAKRFDVLRVSGGEEERFYLKLKGGIKPASPGLTRMSRQEAERVIREDAAQELRRQSTEPNEECKEPRQTEEVKSLNLNLGGNVAAEAARPSRSYSQQLKGGAWKNARMGRRANDLVYRTAQ